MLIERLQGIKARYEEGVMQLSQPETASDTALLTKLMREQAELAPLVALIDEYAYVLTQIDEALRMLADEELRELAQSELEELSPRKDGLEREIQVMLLPKDPNDARNVVIEIRAGTGGEEAALFGQVLYRMYTRYAERRGWKTEVLFQSPTELGGMKEISFTIEGRGAYSRLKYESGAHRVQRVPETETQGRIHTSAATVAVLPEADDVDIAIEMTDLRIDTFRAGGAGGQHVNRTDSAVRITHIPTGIVVQCQNERSQLQNREACMRMLRARLMDEAVQQQQSAMASDRKTQIGSGDRSERIRTYNFPQGRVTDHRTGQTLYQLGGFLDGDMDIVIDALIVKDQTERLALN